MTSIYLASTCILLIFSPLGPHSNAAITKNLNVQTKNYTLNKMMQTETIFTLKDLWLIPSKAFQTLILWIHLIKVSLQYRVGYLWFILIIQKSRTLFSHMVSSLQQLFQSSVITLFYTLFGIQIHKSIRPIPEQQFWNVSNHMAGDLRQDVTKPALQTLKNWQLRKQSPGRGTSFCLAFSWFTFPLVCNYIQSPA